MPQARAALDARRDELARRAEEAGAALAAAAREVPWLLLVELEFEIARLSAECEWVPGSSPTSAPDGSRGLTTSATCRGCPR
ncbi:hypothetical protein GCM10009609_70300 [Pseudonocardia aurantiaca]|uniref:Uncharacterized protein n=1 Tax=Pseudonocardia aurantiaca TaxID=75290 RepID=A0ABW4FSG9_9PSEU